MKSEPGVYSIADLERDGKTPWEGVRNYQARNLMRDQMKVGDLVLFYHSSSEPPCVAGIGRVASAAYPDATQFEKKSPYYDERAKKDDPPWLLVDVEHVETFAAPVPLERLKKDAKLEGMMVTKRGMRLSVQPVEPAHFRRVLAIAGAKSRE
jgi:predicted RNA-binding protein with PUA-like domain